jgi:serine protease AprX
MRRWLALAACVAMAAACRDGTQPLGPGEDPGPRQLVSLSSGVVVDPVLRSALLLASPLQKLEVIVTYDEARTTGSAVAAAVRGTGAGIIPFKHLPMVFALATPAQISRISATPGVESLFSNKQLRYLLAESVPSIRADLAHAAGYTGRGVGIAILDSGVDGFYSRDVNYPPRLVQNAKFAGSVRDLVTFEEGEPAPAAELFVENVHTSETTVGHGTHVAGTAAGDGTESGGKYLGVAPRANVVGVGVGDILFAFWILAGFDYILDRAERHNIQVVNNSWGGSGDFIPEDPINVATKKLYDRGIAVVFSAGNEGPGENTLNPYSAAPWVISVAAGCKTVSPDPTNSASQCAGGQGLLADFSSRGRSGDPLYHPDVTAPGVFVVATRSATGTVINALAALDDLTTCQIPDAMKPFYTCISGTSMAAPHVAGTIALMEEAAGGQLTPAQAYAAIVATARPMTGYAEWEVGAGYLDAYAAVQAVEQ